MVTGIDGDCDDGDPIRPENRTCNGEDDDCDGLSDENALEIQKTCDWA